MSRRFASNSMFASGGRSANQSPLIITEPVGEDISKRPEVIAERLAARAEYEARKKGSEVIVEAVATPPAKPKKAAKKPVEVISLLEKEPGSMEIDMS
jgi:hypothetical protein